MIIIMKQLPLFQKDLVPLWKRSQNKTLYAVKIRARIFTVNWELIVVIGAMAAVLFFMFFIIIFFKATLFRRCFFILVYACVLCLGLCSFVVNANSIDAFSHKEIVLFMQLLLVLFIFRSYLIPGLEIN